MKGQQIQKSIAESARVVAALRKQAGRIEAIGCELVSCLQRGGTVFTAGNGGSAAEALHMAEELTGRYRSNRRPLPAVCLAADATAITCIGNDFGFGEIFKRQLEALGRPGDVAILFTTSGKSENLLKALAAAGKRGVKTICLLGRGGGRMAGKGDWEIIVGSQSTGRIQEAHQVIMHLLLEMIEEAFGNTR
jgi:D-sedoheptulose 7-phosphate isomerase